MAGGVYGAQLSPFGFPDGVASMYGQMMNNEAQKEATQLERDKYQSMRDTQERLFGEKNPRHDEQGNKTDFYGNRIGRTESGARSDKQNYSSGAAGKSTGDFLSRLLGMLGDNGGADIDAGGTTTVGDISQADANRFGPLLAMIQSMFGTQTGADTANRATDVTKELGLGRNSNELLNIQNQKAIAEGGFANAEKLKGMDIGALEAKRASDLSRFLQIHGPKTSADMSNDLGNSRSIPKMFG